MSRRLSFVIVLGIIAIGFVLVIIWAIPESDIPILTVSSKGNKMEVIPGSVIWNNIDGCPTVDWEDGGRQEQQFVAVEGDSILLDFDYSPNRYELHKRENDGNYNEVYCDNDELIVSGTENVATIYMIKGHWREGEASYIIRIDAPNEASELKQYVFEGQVTSLRARDGRTGEEFELTGDELSSFNELFSDTTFIEVQEVEDIVGYIFWVRIVTDSGNIEFSGSSAVNVNGSTMSFVSRQRYSEIMTFLEEHKSHIDD